MNYEEKYNEALERAQKATRAGGDVAKEIVQNIFPELRESEDGRIRKWIIEKVQGYADSGLPYPNEIQMANKALVWLEKQKELFESGRGLYYYDGEKITYCGYPATEENPYDFAMSQQEKKQKEQKEIPLMNGDADLYFDNWIQHNDTTKRGCFEEGIRYAQRLQKEQNPEGVYVDCTEHPEWYGMPPKEQKPASTEDMPYITDEHFYEREPKDSFKYKLAEYMTKCCTKKEGPYGYTYGISAETILKMAEEELLKRGVVQKPAEWSEEDENALKYLHELISFGYTEKFFDAQTAADMRKWLNTRLKSLRPQAKQEWSEEDRLHYANVLEALEYVKGCKSDYDKVEAIKSDITWFKSLRPQPKVELSEDVKKTLDEVSHILIGLNYKQVAKDYKQAVEKLLYSHPHWKPSEEQEEPEYYQHFDPDC